MKENQNLNQKIRVIHFESMTRIPFIEHFFTTRHADLGKKGFRYLRTNSPDAKQTLCNLGLQGKTMAFTQQAHTDHITVLKTMEDVEALSASDEPLDGLVTQLKNVALFTVYADCTPVYAVDVALKVIGLVHSGWRGTVQGIAPKMIGLMQTHYGSALNDIQIVIGPSIGVLNFEVGEEVVARFEATFGVDEEIVHGGFRKPHIDVRKAIEKSLLKCGILKQNIQVSSQCTFAEEENFYSYRREGQEAGRMAAVLVLTE